MANQESAISSRRRIGNSARAADSSARQTCSRLRAPDSRADAERGAVSDGSALMNTRDPIDPLHSAKRNSPWFVMSVLAHVILLVVLGLMFVRSRGAKVST